MILAVNVTLLMSPLSYGIVDCDISLKRGSKRLVKDGVLKALDFSDFGTCGLHKKGKQTN
jgi:hypothetical protein